MRSILTLLSVVILFSFSSCDGTANKSASKVESNFDFSGLVKEVIQTSKYTYCLMEEGGSDYWIAVSKMSIDEGQILYYNYGLEMKDFKSKELNRTFPSVYFIQESSTEPNAVKPAKKQMQMQPKTPEIVKNDFDVEKAEGGITISELYSNKEKYAGKIVKIRGKVTKFNPAIMNRNWLHIQDGTDNNGQFDLTVTTLEKVNVGAVVTLEGVIALDKDFGAGYAYELIMEESKIVK